MRNVATPNIVQHSAIEYTTSAYSAMNQLGPWEYLKMGTLLGWMERSVHPFQPNVIAVLPANDLQGHMAVLELASSSRTSGKARRLFFVARKGHDPCYCKWGFCKPFVPNEAIRHGSLHRRDICPIEGL